MIATINHEGQLRIQAENKLEAFALGQWGKSYGDEARDDATLNIDTEIYIPETLLEMVEELNAKSAAIDKLPNLADPKTEGLVVDGFEICGCGDETCAEFIKGADRDQPVSDPEGQNRNADVAQPADSLFNP